MNSDMYAGFDEPAMGAQQQQALLADRAVRAAMAKTSQGRRPTTGAVGGGARMATAIQRTQTATSFDPNAVNRTVAPKKPEETAEEECKKIEKLVNELMEQSIFACEKADYRMALEKAKEAGRMERKAVKKREQLNLTENVNMDLTFNVLFNLAHQYNMNEMYNEALNTYQVLVKNKQFTTTSRLKVNIGNIYCKKKEYDKAIKYYRMALDQINNVQKESRIKLLNNIGVAFVKMGKYDEAMRAFEQCMEEKPEMRTCLNLLLCAYTLADADKMKDAFVRMLDIQVEDDDNEHASHDALRQWVRARRHHAERTILTGAKLISPCIAASFAAGYAWCVDSIKQSVYAELASDLEINKAIELLRARDLPGAASVLKSFEKKDSKVASAAANNLSFLRFLEGNLQEAAVFAEQAITIDRYNANALVNRGNVHFQANELELARQFYREALANEASCVEALYNLGLTCKRMQKMEEALDCFYKLNNMLKHNVQVLCQLALIYETLEDSAQAIELLTQASNLAPTDPSILQKLGELYDMEGDKSQAFQCHYDSYRYYPSNIEVIEWLGAYYIDAQFCEKAVNYFERASIMQPTEVKWQLMMASCHRRSGNYHKALDTYKSIHRRFPDNVECLKFLVRLCTDLGMPEAKEYANKAKKLEKVRELREQRIGSGGGGGGSATVQRRLGSAVRGGSAGQASAGRMSLSRGSLRTASAHIDFANDDGEYQMTNKREIDTSYSDPLGPAKERPKTGAGGKRREEDFQFDEVDDSLLPE